MVRAHELDRRALSSNSVADRALALLEQRRRSDRRATAAAARARSAASSAIGCARMRVRAVLGDRELVGEREDLVDLGEVRRRAAPARPRRAATSVSDRRLERARLRERRAQLAGAARAWPARPVPSAAGSSCHSAVSSNEQRSRRRTAGRRRARRRSGGRSRRRSRARAASRAGAGRHHPELRRSPGRDRRRRAARAARRATRGAACAAWPQPHVATTTTTISEPHANNIASSCRCDRVWCPT